MEKKNRDELLTFLWYLFISTGYGFIWYLGGRFGEAACIFLIIFGILYIRKNQKDPNNTEDKS